MVEKEGFFMLQTAYYGVANRLERIDFPSIWPGFSSGSFALFQEKLACLSGQLVPRPPEFRGNTSILWQGSPLAIWNLEQEMDLDQLASYLVHELFHAHQLASGETRFPQDIRLALSPAPLPSLASRLQEGRLLAQAASAGPEAAQAHLTDFCALRRQRQERPECLQECLVETVEGTAEFVGLQALRTLSPEKYQRELDRYRALLQQPGPLLTDARRMAYYTGALTLLSARRAGLDLRHPLPGQSQPLFSFLNRLLPSVPPPPLSSEALEEAAALAEQEDRTHHQAVARFLEQTPRDRAGPFRICGYDPMNQFAVDGKLFCTHFLALQDPNTGSILSLPGQSLLILTPGSAELAEGVYHR